MKLIGPIVALAILLSIGIADRWIRELRRNPKELQVGCKVVETIPAEIGPWKGSEAKLDSLVERVSACTAYKLFRYRNTITGQVVDFSLMIGPAGEMAEHLPEVCYASLGYTLQKNTSQLTSVKKYLGDDADGVLARLDFQHRQSENPVRVYHGWFDGKSWRRPEYPRLSFAGYPALYRLQLHGQLIPLNLNTESSDTIDPADNFLQTALPVITKHLESADTLLANTKAD